MLSTMPFTFNNESRCWSHKHNINTCLDVKSGTVRHIELISHNVWASTQCPVGVQLSKRTGTVTWNHRLSPVLNRFIANNVYQLIHHYELRLSIQCLYCLLNVTIATKNIHSNIYIYILFITT